MDSDSAVELGKYLAGRDYYGVPVESFRVYEVEHIVGRVGLAEYPKVVVSVVPLAGKHQELEPKHIVVSSEVLWGRNCSVAVHNRSQVMEKSCTAASTLHLVHWLGNSPEEQKSDLVPVATDTGTGLYF